MFAIIKDRLAGALLGVRIGYRAIAMSAVPGFKDGRIHCFEKRSDPAREKRGSSETKTVVLFDIDNFKLVNDRYGYDAGNLVLDLFGTVCGMYFRRESEKVRLGGDEFAIEVVGPSREWVEMRVKAVQARFKFELVSVEFLAEIIRVTNGNDIGLEDTFGLVAVSAGVSEDFLHAELGLKAQKLHKTYSYR